MSNSNIRTGRTERISFYVTPEQRDQLEDLAARSHTYMAGVAYEIVCDVLHWVPPTTTSRKIKVMRG